MVKCDEEGKLCESNQWLIAKYVGFLLPLLRIRLHKIVYQEMWALLESFRDSK